MQETIKNTFSQIMLTQALLSKTRDPNGRPYFRLTGQVFGRADGQDSRAFRGALANYHRDHGKAPILPRVDPAWRGLAVTNSTQPQLFVARRLAAAGDGSGEAAAMGLPGDYERTVRDAAIAIQGVLNSQVLIANPGLSGGGHKGLIGRGEGMDGFLVQPLRFMDIVWLDRNLDALDNIAVPERVLAEFNAALNADQAARAAGLSVRAGAAGAASPLQLVTARPIFLKGSHNPSPAPGPHRLITGPVGSDGAGHDIAAVKATLRLIAMAGGGEGDNNSDSNGGGGTPFWPGAIDGRGGAALARAISEFHSQVGLGEVNTVTPTSPGEAELQKYLPAGYEKLCGLRGTELVLLQRVAPKRPEKVLWLQTPADKIAADEIAANETSTNETSTDRTGAAGGTRPAWQQSGGIYNELARLTDITWQQTGQRLAVHHIARTSTDQAGITIGLDGVGFLDDGLRPLPAGEAPAAFGEALKNLLGEAIASFGFLTLHTRTENGNLLLISKDPVFAAAESGHGDPALQFESPPAAPPAGHNLIDAPVTATSTSAHNIAAVQAALSLIGRPLSLSSSRSRQGRASPLDQPFWSGGITGQWSEPLANAIKNFQAASGLIDASGQAQSHTEAGTVTPGGPTERHLLGRLPENKRRLKAVKGTTVLYLAEPGKAAPAASLQIKQALGQLPAELKDGLEQARQLLHEELGLHSHIRTLLMTPDKPVVVVLALTGITWLGKGFNPRTSDYVPDELKTYLHRQSFSLPHYQIVNIDRDIHLHSNESVLDHAVDDPVGRFKSGPKPRPLAHGLIDGQVDAKGGAIHDIAALQAALKLIQRPKVAASFYHYPINGQYRKELTEALKMFQTASGLEPTGTVQPGDETESHLLGRLPQKNQKLRGLKDMGAVFVHQGGAIKAPNMSGQARADFHQGDVPNAMREAMKKAELAIWRRFGLAIEFFGFREPVGGKAEIKYRVPGVSWLDQDGLPTGSQMLASTAAAAGLNATAELAAEGLLRAPASGRALGLTASRSFRIRPDIHHIDGAEILIDTAWLLEKNRELSEKYAIDLGTLTTSGIDAATAAVQLARVGLKVAENEIAFKQIMGRSVVALKSGPALLNALATGRLAADARTLVVAATDAAKAVKAPGAGYTPKVFLVGVVIVGFIRYEEYQLGQLDAQDARLYFMTDVGKQAVAAIAAVIASTFISGSLVPIAVAIIAAVVVSAIMHYYEREYGLSDQIVDYFNSDKSIIGNDFGPEFPVQPA